MLLNFCCLRSVIKWTAIYFFSHTLTHWYIHSHTMKQYKWKQTHNPTLYSIHHFNQLCGVYGSVTWLWPAKITPLTSTHQQHPSSISTWVRVYLLIKMSTLPQRIHTHQQGQSERTRQMLFDMLHFMLLMMCVLKLILPIHKHYPTENTQ